MIICNVFQMLQVLLPQVASYVYENIEEAVILVLYLLDHFLEARPLGVGNEHGYLLEMLRVGMDE